MEKPKIEPMPRGLILREDSKGEPNDAVTIDGWGLYATESLRDAPAGSQVRPDFVVTQKWHLAGAQHFLFAKTRKTLALDGVVSYYAMRPTARWLTRAIVNTPVSPNMATAFALMLGVGAAILAGLGQVETTALAGAIYWAAGVVDHIDGELARLRLASSKFGEWFDSVTDEISTYALLIGLSVGLARANPSSISNFGFAGAILGVLAVTALYCGLYRLRLPADTAQFPWFFRQKSRPSRFSWLGAASWILRRDVNVTIIAALLLAGWAQAAVVTMAVGATLGFIATVTHFAVLRARKKNARF